MHIWMITTNWIVLSLEVTISLNPAEWFLSSLNNYSSPLTGANKCPFFNLSFKCTLAYPVFYLFLLFIFLRWFTPVHSYAGIVVKHVHPVSYNCSVFLIYMFVRVDMLHCLVFISRIFGAGPLPFSFLAAWCGDKQTLVSLYFCCF